ncbi:MAG: YdcF family protein [Synechococcales cyanobacterium RM1_1_8]|nr:YdcF family protein [Synechococcales cyanobacterium RM1_1_8]
MYELLTQVLLWLLIGYVAWFVLKQFIPEKVYTFLGFALLVALIVLAFFRPDQDVVSEAWSILSLPFRPLGFALLLLLSVFPFKEMTQWKVLQNRVFWAILLLLLTSAPATAYWFNEQAEQEVTALIRSAPAINGPLPIVLLAQDTTRPRIAPRQDIELTERGDRLRYAARLYREQPGSSVIVAAARRTNVSLEGERREEVNDVRTLLGTFGVPPERVIEARRSSTIHDSAVAVEKVISEQIPGTQELVLVTSALEMHRAASTFTQELQQLNNGNGIKIIPRATGFVSIQEEDGARRRFRLPKDLIPSEHALYLTSLAIQEQFLSVYYFLRGWLSSVV